MSIFKSIGVGLFREVHTPKYGGQDIGHSPGGPMDRFSMQIGNIALGNEAFAPAVEIISINALEFGQDSLFVLVGAKRKGASLHQKWSHHQESLDVYHGMIGLAQQGDRIILGTTEYGFRTYLCHTPCDAGNISVRQRSLIGRTIPQYSEICTSEDPENRIRVLKGPECCYLEDPAIFLEQPWMTTTDMSDMGIRLSCLSGEQSSWNRMEMISAPVNDGTVQLTPRGPIVLLRMRQTMGGYPRIFNVIGPDLDILGQYAPMQVVHFREVSLEESLGVAARRKQDVDEFKFKWA